jgi:putative component of toxin-antitoxin plasmid stabilization module
MIANDMFRARQVIILKEWFNKIKDELWYKQIDEFLSMLVNGQLSDKDIIVIDGKTIEEIVSENINENLMVV